MIIGTGVAILVTVALQMTVGGLSITSEILVRAMPTPQAVVLSTLIAISAGAAASLALVTEPHRVEQPWGQVIDAIIGVEIAISLVPPAAVIGIGWVLGTPEHSFNAFKLLMLNVVCLDLVGSLAILAIGGVRRRHLLLERAIRAAVATQLDVVPGFISVGSTVDIRLHNEHEAQIDVILRRAFGGKVPESLAETIAQHVAEQTGSRCNLTIAVVPLLTHTGLTDLV